MRTFDPLHTRKRRSKIAPHIKYAWWKSMLPNKPTSQVVAVSKSQSYTFSKSNCQSITLVAGLGVAGDAHFGETVKHRSRVRADPTQPNLRQVHLIHQELLDVLKKQGFDVDPGVMGENITTVGIDLLQLVRGTLLQIGTSAVVEITGLRDPCKQLDNYQTGLTSAVLDRTDSGELIRKAGVMGIVINGGEITASDLIKVSLPAEPHEKLERV